MILLSLLHRLCGTFETLLACENLSVISFISAGHLKPSSLARLFL
jgi:hypothetical protein